MCARADGNVYQKQTKMAVIFLREQLRKGLKIKMKDQVKQKWAPMCYIHNDRRMEMDSDVKSSMQGLGRSSFRMRSHGFWNCWNSSSKGVILERVGGRVLKATSLAALGEGDVWRTNPKLLDSVRRRQAQKNTQAAIKRKQSRREEGWEGVQSQEELTGTS